MTGRKARKSTEQTVQGRMIDGFADIVVGPAGKIEVLRPDIRQIVHYLQDAPDTLVSRQQ
jgi:hypothetical protein